MAIVNLERIRAIVVGIVVDVLNAAMGRANQEKIV
jgi:hypothetical protein